jgi:hypothetical protein
MSLSRSKRTQWRAVFATTLAAFVVVAGIAARSGSDGDDARSLHGQLFVDGQPAAGAEVRFYSLNQRQLSRPVGSARSNGDGSFHVRSSWSRSGLPAGEYVVTAIWRDAVIAGENLVAGPNRLPRRYANPNTSPLKARVQEGITQLPPWSLPGCDCGG